MFPLIFFSTSVSFFLSLIAAGRPFTMADWRRSFTPRKKRNLVANAPHPFPCPVGKIELRSAAVRENSYDRYINLAKSPTVWIYYKRIFTNSTQPLLYDQVSIKGLQTAQSALYENGRGMKLGMWHDFCGHFKFEFKLGFKFEFNF